MNKLLVFLILAYCSFASAADSVTVVPKRLADEATVSEVRYTNYVLVTVRVGTNNIVRRVDLNTFNNEINAKQFDSLQSAIDYAATLNGATVRIPVGEYVIDSVSNSLELANNVNLRADVGARFTMAATTNDAYVFIKVWNVTNCSISGIKIEGYRDSQTNSPVGFGISIRNSENVVVDSCSASSLYGDAIYIGGSAGSKDITIINSFFTNSVRNNISIVNGSNINILNSKFYSANYKDPQAGIDIEPNVGNQVENVSLLGNDFYSNYNYGLYVNRGGGNFVRNVQIIANRFVGNSLGAAAPGVKINYADNVLMSHCISERNDYGCYISYSTNIVVESSDFTYNTYDGITLEGSENVRIENSVLSKNGRHGILMTGSISGWPYNIGVSGCSISRNTERAVSVIAGSNPKISDCSIILNGQDGIWFQDCSDPTALNNYIAGQSQSVNNTYAGIRLAGVVYGARVDGNTVRKSPRWLSGTASGGDTNNIVFTSSAVPKTNFYAGYDIVISSGTGVGQRNRITIYDQTTYTATVVTNWTLPPDNTSVYEIQLTNYQANSIRVDTNILDSIVINNDVRLGGTWSVPTNSFLMAGNVGVSLPYFIVGGTDLSDTYLSVVGGNSKVFVTRNGYDKEAMMHFVRSGTDEWKIGSSDSDEFIPAGAFTIAKSDTTGTPAMMIDTSFFVGFHTNPTNAAQVSIQDNNAQLRLEFSDSTFADFYVNAGLRLDVSIMGYPAGFKVYTNHVDITGLRLPGYDGAAGYVWTLTNATTGAGHWAEGGTNSSGGTNIIDYCAITNVLQVGLGSNAYPVLVSHTNLGTFRWAIDDQLPGLEWAEDRDSDFNLVQSDDNVEYTDPERGKVIQMPAGDIGSNLHCKATNAPTLAGDFTISLWLNPMDNWPGEDNQFILHKLSGGYGISVTLSNDATVKFYVADSLSQSAVVSGGYVISNAWNLIVVRATVSDADLILDLWVNGVKATPQTISGVGSLENVAPITLGADSVVIDRHVAGLYDELVYFASALSDCAIESQFTGCLCDKETQVKAMEQGYGIIITNKYNKLTFAIDTNVIASLVGSGEVTTEQLLVVSNQTQVASNDLRTAIYGTGITNINGLFAQYLLFKTSALGSQNGFSITPSGSSNLILSLSQDLEDIHNAADAAANGSILLKTNNTWSYIPAGTNGQVLTTDFDLYPKWITPSFDTVIQAATNYAKAATNDLAAAARGELLSRATEVTNLVTSTGYVYQDVAYATDLVLDLRTNIVMTITNEASGNINLLVTNVTAGKWGRVRVKADGTARTVFPFYPANTTVDHQTTNATVNTTNLYVVASKVGILGFMGHNTGDGNKTLDVITSCKP